MKTITIRITANDSGEVLELLDKAAEEISDKNIEDISEIEIHIDDLDNEELCYQICYEDITKCACHQERVGCDNYHRWKEDQLIDNHNENT